MQSGHINDCPAATRLFCFPHAGGNALSFRHWPAMLPREIHVHAVELPGRHARFREAPLSRMEDLIDILLLDLGQFLTPPLALFGHSLGALVAFAFAHALVSRTSVRPSYLFVSACPAPHARPPSSLYRLSDEQFLKNVSRMIRLPSNLSVNSELMTLMLPTLRADVCLFETYREPRYPRLDLPIAAFGGLSDQHVSRAGLGAWRDRTTGPFCLHQYPGDHHYSEENPKPLLANIGSLLSLQKPFHREEFAS
jgi:medium-chain acyl-[acyl-carrier-protein] hydrolase